LEALHYPKLSWSLDDAPGPAFEASQSQVDGLRLIADVADGAALLMWPLC
jgi:hypothetical protein